MQHREHHYIRPPIALIVTAQEWVALSVETLFSPRGYAVLRAFSGAQALQRTSDFEPDLIVADQDLRDMRGSELARALRERGGPASTTPVLLISTSHWTRDERLDALRGGAWDTCALPVDGEELFLRADAWVRAKLAADQARDEGLLDAATGFYNAQGLLRRIAEVAAGAGRRRAPLACVVISSEAEAAAPRADAASVSHSMAERLRAAGRASDTIGRLSENEFVVLAPDTDSTGAAGLARRLKQVIEKPAEADSPALRLRFGCYAVRDFRDASIAPSEMLIRAAEALRSGPLDDDSIRFFTPTIPGSN
ncbi:MAG TPA: response regulator [Longimicrobiales bacterium]|nr:response regulator [Longimicrobiales bacterium]